MTTDADVDAMLERIHAVSQLAIDGAAFFAAFWEGIRKVATMDTDLGLTEATVEAEMATLFGPLAAIVGLDPEDPDRWQLTERGQRLYSLGYQTLQDRARPDAPPCQMT